MYTRVPSSAAAAQSSSQPCRTRAREAIAVRPALTFCVRVRECVAATSLASLSADRRGACIVYAHFSPGGSSSSLPPLRPSFLSPPRTRLRRRKYNNLFFFIDIIIFIIIILFIFRVHNNNNIIMSVSD